MMKFWYFSWAMVFYFMVTVSAQKVAKEIQDYLVQAHICYEKNLMWEALANISEAIAISPRVEDLLTKGQWLEQSKQWQLAYQTYKHALDLSVKIKDKLKCKKYLAESALRLKRYEEAYQHYLNLVSHSQQANIYLKMAQAAFYSQKDLIAHRLLLKLQNDFKLSQREIGNVYYYQGLLCYRSKNLYKALKYLGIALEKVDDTSKIEWQLARIYYELQRFTKARTHLENILKSFSNNAQFCEMLGDCYFRNKQYRKAIFLLHQGIHLEPWRAQLYLKRAQYYIQLKAWREATRDLRECLTRDPHNVTAMSLLLTTIINRPLVNYYQLIAVLDSIKITTLHISLPDLFAKDQVKIATHKITPGPSISAKNFTWATWLKRYLTNTDKEVDTVLVAFLPDTYHNKKLYKYVEELLQSPMPSSHRTKLQQLRRNLYDKHLHQNTQYIRSLLIKYYRFQSAKMLMKIYQNAMHLEGLQTLLEDKEEHTLVRFWAVQALADLTTPESFAALKKYAQSKDYLAQLFSQITLIQKYREKISDFELFLKAQGHRDAFVRFLAAYYMPFHKQHLHSFLQDSDVRVRLGAAQRLQTVGDQRANQVLQKNINHKSPVIRLWSVIACGSYIPTKKIDDNQILPLLVKSARDNVPEIRGAALVFLSQWMEQMPKKQSHYSSVLAKHISDQNALTKIRAVLALGKFSAKQVMPTVLNNKETFLIRVLAISMVLQSNSIGHIMTLLNVQQRDPDPRIRLFLSACIANISNPFFANFWRQQLHSQDYITRIGAIWGLGKKIKPALLRKFLQDHHPQVQKTAAAMSSLLLEHSLRNKVFSHFKKSSQLRKAAAMGYVHDIEEQVWKRAGIEKLSPKNIFNHKTTEQLLIQSLKNIFEKASAKRLTQYEANYTYALQLSPNHKYYFEMGVLYAVKGEYVRSIALMKKAKKLSPDIITGDLHWAEVYYRIKKYTMARTISEKLLQKNYQDQSVWNLYQKVLTEEFKELQSKGNQKNLAAFQKKLQWVTKKTILLNKKQ